MSYHPLDEKTVIDYVMARPAMEAIFPRDARLASREVGDGNLNQVFILEDLARPGQSAVLKQALPWLRVAGDSWPLDRKRMLFESRALLLYNDLAPGLAPQVYDHDDEMSTVVMEHLDRHDMMRHALVARKRFPRFADDISTFMARTLFFTSDLFLPGKEKKAMLARFINDDLCKLQEDFVFGNPYMDSPDNKWNPLLDAEVQAVRRNGPLKVAIAEMKESYMTHAQALLHGDLHTGSVMLNRDDTRVIDPEFAFFGPIGYDVGAVLENIVLAALSHYGHTPDPAARIEYQDYLLDTMREIWVQFERKWEQLWVENNAGELQPAKYWDFPGGEEAFADFRRRYMANVWRDTHRARRLQDAAPDDGHRQRVRLLLHEELGAARPRRARRHPDRRALGHRAQRHRLHRRPRRPRPRGDGNGAVVILVCCRSGVESL